MYRVTVCEIAGELQHDGLISIVPSSDGESVLILDQSISERVSLFSPQLNTELMERIRTIVSSCLFGGSTMSIGPLISLIVEFITPTGTNCLR